MAASIPSALAWPARATCARMLGGVFSSSTCRRIASESLSPEAVSHLAISCFQEARASSHSSAAVGKGGGRRIFVSSWCCRPASWLS